MLDVLHVNDYRDRGGAEVLLNRLIDLQRAAGLRVERWTADDLPGHRRTPASYINNSRARTALAAYLSRTTPRIVHLHNIYHELSPGILRVIDNASPRPGIIFSAHDFHLVCPNPSLCWFRGRDRRLADIDRLTSWSYLLTRRWDERGWTRSLLRLLQRARHYALNDARCSIDVILAPSRFSADVLQRCGFPSTISYNPAPHPPRDPAPAAKPAGIFNAVCVGRVEPEKGQRWMLESWPTDLDARLTIIGDGADLLICRRIAAARGLADRVTFTGPLDRTAAMDHMSAAHVLLLPSLVPESAGLAALEAIARGAFVLTGDQGGAAEIVADSGCGATFRLGDLQDFAKVLRRIVAQHQAGTLHPPDAAAFLLSRSEDCYLNAITAAYEHALASRSPSGATAAHQ